MAFSRLRYEAQKEREKKQEKQLGNQGNKGRVETPAPTRETTQTTTSQKTTEQKTATQTTTTSRLRREAQKERARKGQQEVEVRRYIPAPTRDVSAELEELVASTASRREELTARLEAARQKEAEASRAQILAANEAMRTNDPTKARGYADAVKAASDEYNAIKRELEQLDYLEKYKDKTYDDTFVGQFGANRTLGRLGQDTSAAYNEYLQDPTEENKAYAEALDLLTEHFQVQNKTALDDVNAKATWITQDLAQNLPQRWDQIKAGVAGAAAAGLPLALVNPALGVTGAKWGATAGVGKQSYDQMRGAAFQTLLNAGIDEEIARQAAGDEAVLSAMAEMADTAYTIGSAGVTAVAKAFGKGGTKAVAKEAAKGGTPLLAKALAKYGINIPQEILEEGFQQTVSIANLERAKRGETGFWNLVGETVDVARDAITGENTEARDEIVDAGWAGGKLAIMMGGVNYAADTALTTGVNSYVGKKYSDAESVQALIDSGLESAEGTESRKLAEKLQAKKQAGKTISNAEVGALQQANVAAMEAEQQTQPTEAAEEPQETLERLARETVGAQQETAESEAVGQEATTQRTSVPYNAMATDNPARQSVVQAKSDLKKLTGYGEEGQKLFDEIREQNGVSDAELIARFDTPYQAGLTGLPMNQANLINDFQREAYNAGRLDNIARMAKDEAHKPGAILSEKDSGFDFTGAPKDLTQEQKDFAVFFSKAMGVAGKFDGKNGKADYNALFNRKTGSVAFAQDFGISPKLMEKLGSMDYMQKVEQLADKRGRSFIFYVAHEIADHAAADRAPKQMRAFNNAMYNYLQSHPTDDSETIRKKQMFYASHNVDLDAHGATEEVSADNILVLYDGDEQKFMDAMRRIFNSTDEQAKEGARIYKNKLDEIISKLKAWFRKLTGKENAEAIANVEKSISELEQLRNMFEEAIAESMRTVRDARAKGIDNAEMQADNDGNNIQHSMKEDRDNDKNRVGGVRRSGGEEGSHSGGGKTVRDALGQISGRLRVPARRGVSASFGEKPKSSWAKHGVIEAAAGSVAQAEQQIAMDYGVPSFVISDKVWKAQGKKAPAFSRGGQIYFRETMPDKFQGRIAGHELTHVMKQVGFQPYLDFVERTPDMLDLSTSAAREMLEQTAKHRGVDMTAMNDATQAKLYDEFNATMYGYIVAGDKRKKFYEAFRDFDSYSRELTELHRQFKESRTGNQYSLKDSDYMKAVNSGDMETAQRMVDAAAKAAGFQGAYYHGSRSDFTVFSKAEGGQSNSDASIGFWFAETAEGAKKWADETWYGNREDGKVYKTYLDLKNPKVYETVDNKAQIDELHKGYEDIDKEMSLYDSIYYFEDGRRYHHERYDYDKSKNRPSGISEWDAFKAIVKKYDAGSIEYYLEQVPEADRQTVKKDAERYLELSKERKALEKQISELRYSDAYELYRTDIYKLAGMGAEDANIGGTGRYIDNKRDVMQRFLENLKSEGHDGIVIKNTSYDSQIFGGVNNQYVVFEPNQIKSADPVTYDDNGNVIPLSQRFNTENDDIRYSIKSTAHAAGLEVGHDEKGKVVFKMDGKVVTSVTADHIKNNSGLGALITVAADKGNITRADAKKQYTAMAEIMNMIMRTQDPDLVWAWVGSSMFSALKSNADGQYGTTIDFTTVCRKTQDIITAMSRAMMQMKRGLTKDEVTRLQAELIGVGSSVPCPVCYVFSRWAGIGSILDNMYRWQEKYDGYTDEQLSKRVDELTEKLGKGKAKDLKKMLREQDEEYDSLDHESEMLSLEKKQLTAKRKKAIRDNDAYTLRSVDDRLSQVEKRIPQVKKRMNEIKASVAPELAWLLQVRTDPDYAKHGKVKANVLFNLDDAATFAESYPLAWKYRTSRGPSAGKAILPYSDMRLGDMILGVDSNSASGNDLFANVSGRFNEQQMAALDKAIKRTKAQNLIGGQRFQSTSDFRYDYALDYLMAFFEAQALGSKMQTYTKIIEFADMVAAVGGDVNLSVMPKNKGFITTADGVNRLVFSSVTGIDFEAAKRANELHDSAQLILVGINDEHILAALEDSEETQGKHIGFVIPYHASGASINEFIRVLVSNLGESFTLKYYQDYSDVQSDKERANATAAQKRRNDLRSNLLKGKDGGKSWEPNADDLAFIRGKSVDISGKSFADLRSIERKALSGNKAAIAEYESWTAGALWDLYNKMWVEGGAEYGVRLNTNQAKAVMPHEYWNKNVTRDKAYINGFLFRSYCYNLGLTPRFTGATVKGEKHGDFTDSKGYWKTLIDRPMYNNDGTYRDQQIVNMTNFQKDMLTKEYAKKHWDGYSVQEPDVVRAGRAADRFIEKTQNGQYSLKGEQAMRDELARIRWEGAKAGKSQADIDAEVAGVVGPEYAKLLKTYGEIKRGEVPYRDIVVPKKSAKNRNVSQTVRTILEAAVTPDSAVPTIQEMITTGEFSYEVYSDKAARAAAEATIRNKGYQTALADWLADVREGKVNKTNTALGWELYNQAATSDDLKTAMTVLNGMVQHQRSAAQALQATRILKKLSPDAQLYGIQKTVDSINEELQQRYGRKSGKRSISDTDNVPVELWMQKTGEILAEQLGSAVKQKTRKEKTVSQRVLADLRKLAKETVTPAPMPADTRTEMDSIYDMFHNREQYEKALQAAKETVAQEYGDKPEIMAALDKWMHTAFDYTAQFTKEITGQTEIRIPTELAEKFLSQTDQEGRDEVTREIYRYVGSQMPSTFVDKWNAWRYLAMLGNPRTHVRNVFGNFGFAIPVVAKDLTATAIESAVSFVSGGKIGRTKAMPSAQLLRAAWDDYANVADQITAGGKYSDSAMRNQYIEEGRQIFKFKPLEKARKGNTAAMGTEDMWFAKPHYAFALAQYCKANGVTVEQLRNGKALGNGREYAIREAQKATYRDTNAFSKTISELGKYHGDNKVKKGVSLVTEGILPFRKTPANILVRGLEYSPIGLANGIKQALWDVQRENKTAAEAIDNIAAGLTGTGLLGLGIYMAAEGLIRGAGGGDDEEKKFEELQGHQTYALELPSGKSITLDWLAPEVLPMFIGVNLYEMASENKGHSNLADILSAVSNVTEPLLEMSCLQSLNDLFDSFGYSDDGLSPLPKALISAATSYLTQAFPTILGQTERSAQDKRMTTYTEKNDFLTSDLQYTLGKISAKIPGWDFNQIPYIDAWGRAEDSGSKTSNVFNNFLNPAYTSQIETSAMEEELQRLYDATGEGSVLPSRAPKYFTVDKERKDLTAEEYVEYATEKGQMSYDMLTELTSGSEYAKMGDTEKTKAVGLVYEYANAIAKTTMSDYEPAGWVAKALEAEQTTGMDEMEYILYKMALEMADGTNETEQKANAISSMSSLSDDEIAFLWDTKSASEAYDAGIDMRTYVEHAAAGDSINVEKLAGAKSVGVSEETYFDFREMLKEYDQPTKSGKMGSFTQDEAAAAIAAMPGLTREQRAYLWQSVNKGWKEKNNPWR